MATELGGRWSGHTGRWSGRYRALERPLGLSLLLLSTLTLYSYSHSLLSEEDSMGRCPAKVHRAVIIVTPRVANREVVWIVLKRDFVTMPHRPEVHRWYCTAGWQRRRALCGDGIREVANS
jgi:hypothetical protein